jgi:hypothetical protein
MRSLLCTTAMALIGPCTLPAVAADSAASPQIVEITAPRSAKAAVQGLPAPRIEDAQYQMSNGSRVAITSYGEIVQMRYERRVPQRLRHDGQGSFVSQDGIVTLKFEADAQGQARLVRLSAPANWF